MYRMRLGPDEPSDPQNCRVKSSNNSTLHVEWNYDRKGNADHFHIQINDTFRVKDNVSMSSVCTNSACTYDVKDLVPGTVNNLSILASFHGENSMGVCHVQGITKPSDPQNCRVKSSNNSTLHVEWNYDRKGNADHFHIQINDTFRVKDNVSMSSVCTNSACMYEVKDLEPGTVNNLSILASFHGENSMGVCHVQGITKPSDPQNCRIKSSDNSTLHVEWNVDSKGNADHFHIQINDTFRDKDNVSMSSACTNSTCMYDVKDLVPGSVNNLSILATFHGENSTGMCHVQGITKPSDPQNCRIKSSDNSTLHVEWNVDSKGNADHFHIQINDTFRDKDNVSMSSACTNSTCMYDVKDLVPGSVNNLSILATFHGENSTGMCHVQGITS
ncbi:hypothetical protein CHS0354_000130 [Potamilus streckersoni]|uniref:Fibronectin type-III domain-containing protein n=1 Tax=Potamilus streckersoni TaxID=2493646 RepID=A0AAE0SER3_9BIVA|nr:hypothetical protein CHS0354_000130 [Potamilus streckersoni]